MGKMFLTKYPSVVENDNLPYLGKMKIHFKTANATSGLRFTLANNSKGESVKVIGGENKILYKSSPVNEVPLSNTDTDIQMVTVGDDCDLLADKYNLSQLSNLGYIGMPDTSFSINDLKYSLGLVILDCTMIDATGDLSSLSHLTNLTKLALGGNFTGDLSSLSHLTNLTTLELNNNTITGDLSSLSSLTNLTTLVLTRYVPNNNITGDLSSLSSLTNLVALKLQRYNTGDLSIIVDNMQKLKNLTFYKNITYTEAQIQTLRDRGVTVTVLS